MGKILRDKVANLSRRYSSWVKNKMWIIDRLKRGGRIFHRAKEIRKIGRKMKNHRMNVVLCVFFVLLFAIFYFLSRLFLFKIKILKQEKDKKERKKIKIAKVKIIYWK